MSTATATRIPTSSGTRPEAERLAFYSDRHGRQREVLARAGVQGSTLVIDRASPEHDEQLLAQLPADEPRENAQIVCSLFLADTRRPRCRQLTQHDIETSSGVVEEAQVESRARPCSAELTDRRGRVYSLEATASEESFPGLRWHCHTPGALPHVVTVRAAVGALESYEPVASLTDHAVAAHQDDPNVSVAALTGELRRLRESPIVLNRGLREAVQGAVQRETSMSEIAIRCGRVKRDTRGTESGETSWLARRIGSLPGAGESEPTPWVHADVLALIAREGLGVAPREVEPS